MLKWVNGVCFCCLVVAAMLFIVKPDLFIPYVDMFKF